MRCSTCGSLLYGVASSVCPECGTEWRIEQFRVLDGSVRIVCNVCGSDLQPHARSGWCASAVGRCPICAHRGVESRAVVLPREHPAHDTPSAPLPWLHCPPRTPVAWVRLVALALVRPKALASSIASTDPPCLVARLAMVNVVATAIAAMIAATSCVGCLGFAIAGPLGGAIGAANGLLLAAKSFCTLCLPIAALAGALHWLDHRSPSTGCVRNRLAVAIVCLSGVLVVLVPLSTVGVVIAVALVPTYIGVYAAALRASKTLAVKSIVFVVVMTISLEALWWL